MSTQKTILAHLILSPKEQQERTKQLLPEFFTGTEKQMIEAILKINATNQIAQTSHFTKYQDYILDLFRHSSLSWDYDGLLPLLKTEYLEREKQNIANLKSIDDVKTKILEIEEKAQILDCVKPQTISEVMGQALEQQTNNPFDLDTLPKTGFKGFDEKFMGFMKGQLCTIGGYSGIGKSTLIFSLIKNLSFQHKTLVFNLEMDNATMSARILSSISGLPFGLTINLANKTTQQKIEQSGLRDKLNKSISELDRIQLSLIDDKYRLNDIILIIRNQAKQGLEFVLIDYLQLIKTDTKNQQRHLEVGEITRELKLLAKELRITIIVLAQLGRASLNKDEPELNDLRESGSIEMDSDLVFLIYKAKNNDRILKLAKDRMFGRYHQATLDYNKETQSYT
jgi:replicative DNA helicase